MFQALCWVLQTTQNEMKSCLMSLPHGACTACRSHPGAHRPIVCSKPLNLTVLTEKTCSFSYKQEKLLAMKPIRIRFLWK